MVLELLFQAIVFLYQVEEKSCRQKCIYTIFTYSSFFFSPNFVFTEYLQLPLTVLFIYLCGFKLLSSVLSDQPEFPLVFPTSQVC